MVVQLLDAVLYGIVHDLMAAGKGGGGNWDSQAGRNRLKYCGYIGSVHGRYRSARERQAKGQVIFPMQVQAQAAAAAGGPALLGGPGGGAVGEAAAGAVAVAAAAQGAEAANGTAVGGVG